MTGRDTTGALLQARPCHICGTSDDVRVAPIMTGDKFGEKPKYPVCSECIRIWYETGETTLKGIQARRLKEMLGEVYTPVGVDLWIAHADKQNWSYEERLQRALNAVDGNFS